MYTDHIAKHLHQVHFGGNWTWSNLKDQLAGINWQQATEKVGSLNTIAALTYHINYFVSAQLKLLNGGPLDAHDKYSYDVPPLRSQEDWESLVKRTLDEGKQLSELISALPDEKLWEVFEQEKYGNYIRNFLGLIEHTHYHLGQIAIIKKLINER